MRSTSRQRCLILLLAPQASPDGPCAGTYRAVLADKACITHSKCSNVDESVSKRHHLNLIWNEATAVREGLCQRA